MKRIAELQETLTASQRAARRQSAPFPRRGTNEFSDAQAFWRAFTPPLMLSCPAMPDEKESFSLVDAASDLFGGLAAGVTVAAVYHDISGILAGPVGVGVAHTLRYGASLFVSRFYRIAKRRALGWSTA